MHNLRVMCGRGRGRGRGRVAKHELCTLVRPPNRECSSKQREQVTPHAPQPIESDARIGRACLHLGWKQLEICHL